MPLQRIYTTYLRRPFTTEWSGKGIAVVMSRLNVEEVEHLVCYASRSCNVAEHNWSSFDEECVAAVWATSHFRSYLFGNSFTLVSDHESLKRIMTTPKLRRKLARWSLLVQGYDFTMVHQANIGNANADYLKNFALPSIKGAPLRKEKSWRPQPTSRLRAGVAIPLQVLGPL